MATTGAAEADHRRYQKREPAYDPVAAADQTERLRAPRPRQSPRSRSATATRAERRTPRRLVLLLRLGDQLLQRTADRLQRLRRPLAQPARAVRRPRGQLAAGRPGRRHAGDQHERQPLGRHRAQHGLPRLRRPVVDRLPRGRPERPVLRGRARLHQAARRCWTRWTGWAAGRRCAPVAGRPTSRCRRPPRSPGERSGYRPEPVAPHRLGARSLRSRDEFDGRARPRVVVGARARRRRRRRRGGQFRFDTQAADLYVDNNTPRC